MAYSLPVGEDGENRDDLPAVKPNNILPIWGRKETMNIPPLILRNIRSSPYFKQDLHHMRSYHEVVDEIYYKVRTAVLVNRLNASLRVPYNDYACIKTCLWCRV